MELRHHEYDEALKVRRGWVLLFVGGASSFCVFCFCWLLFFFFVFSSFGSWLLCFFGLKEFMIMTYCDYLFVVQCFFAFVFKCKS